MTAFAAPYLPKDLCLSLKHAVRIERRTGRNQGVELTPEERKTLEAVTRADLVETLNGLKTTSLLASFGALTGGLLAEAAIIMVQTPTLGLIGALSSPLFSQGAVSTCAVLALSAAGIFGANIVPIALANLKQKEAADFLAYNVRPIGRSFNFPEPDKEVAHRPTVSITAAIERAAPQA